METLDGKYFESTIAALQKAKAAEVILMRADFRDTLKSEVLARAAEMAGPAAGMFDWAAWVLRYKYVFGGVPVLAVLAIVAASALNLQVKIPRTDIVPETMINTSTQQKSAEDVVSSQAVTTGGIRTFSAASVMPPAEILEARARALAAQQAGAGETEQFMEQTEQVEYVFLDGISDQVKLTVPVTIPAKNPEAVKVTTVDVIQVTEVSAVDVEDDLPVGKGTPIQEEPVIPFENSGRAEASGEVPTATQPQEQQEDTSTQLLSDMPAEQPIAQKTVIKVPEVRVESAQYINPVEELSREAEKNDLQLIKAIDPVLPLYLNGDRIKYSAINRDQVVEAVKVGFAHRNGNLSSDYYIVVTALENNTYKATLFEYGQVKQVVILAIRDGILKVVTEVRY